MWVDTADLPTNDGHPFFERLNRVLEDCGFDAFVEESCATFYADRLGRPSLRPGRYFRMLFIGYFEGVSSERGIAWRVGRFAESAVVSGPEPDRGGAGSLDAVSHPGADRRGDPRGGAFPISRSRAHTHRRHGHPLQTVPSAGLIERPQEKNRVDALR